MVEVHEIKKFRMGPLALKRFISGVYPLDEDQTDLYGNYIENDYIRKGKKIENITNPYKQNSLDDYEKSGQ